MPHKDPFKRKEYNAKYRELHREKAKKAAHLWRENNPDRERENQRRGYSHNKVARDAYKREWNKKNARRIRDRKLRNLYGITIEQYEAIWSNQGERCAICQGNSPRGRGWCLDHEHKSGKVRGILCSPCNTAIGLLNEDKSLFLKSIDYLNLS